ncbi:cAMP-responsive element modulator isoform X1 [Neopsephotus bourkii]|uniref:cAMP-responsive element modulator isoform X1 n=3 Tax=Neopsephotus bourkii TaxID=309878 RepID=UPI002AA559D2|nr:cAMP-responsive element modulator isoform X1 [Neopsephotus bourkii]XP_061206066.1 cAMP-responsive element modulator isoform X1 [Neopsephotus bourkii]XP_061206075.1 cAMP-responsive element modulator isoform X1 [Neopsephotus bourkii]
MTKYAKKYRKATARQMTMEMVESQQDDSAGDCMPERDAVRLQNQPGRSHISQGSEVSVAASSAGRGSPALTLAHLPSGQTVHGQGVIQATQPSVIQSPHMQAVQAASIADESAESEGIVDSQKRREILSRRPSYRKILNELSSDAPAIPKIEEEKSDDEGVPSGIPAMAMPAGLYHSNTGQYITITQGGAIQISNPASDGVHGLQTLGMTNSGAPQPGATIVQYAGQSPHSTQQYFVPGSQVVVQAATGDMPAYQIRTPTTTLPQGVVMAASPGTLHSPQQLAEEATRKRELRLMKNREAARECRRKKKEYVKCLENRVAVLENQNKTLIEELKALKDLYCHKAE